MPDFELGKSVLRPRPVGAHAQGGTDVAVFVCILQRQWRVVATCTGTAVAVALFANLLMKPTYEPQARLEVDPPGYEQFSLDSPHVASSDTEYLQTQVQDLQSEELAVAVIRKLGLAPDLDSASPASDPHGTAQDMGRLTRGESAALLEFKRGLKVDHDPGSHVIGVSVAAHDPVEAAKITNTLASMYVERMFDARHDAIVQSTEWLSHQLEDIRKRMDDVNGALADFQRTNGVADVDEGKSTSGELLAELNKQLTQTAADRIQLQALLNKVRNGSPDALPQVHDSLLIQQLTQKLAEVRADLAQSRAIYGPNHPNVIRLENQSGELESELNEQKRAILDEVEIEYGAAQAREHLMAGKVKETTQRLSLMSQYNALKREAQASTELYNSLYSKVREAEISVASKSNNIRVVDRARVLDKPTRPRRLLNLASGFLSGLVLGIVVAFVREGLENKVYTPEDVQQFYARLPVSIVPVIEADGGGRSRHLLHLSSMHARGEAYEPLLLSRPKSAEAEAVRGLRASLMLSGPERSRQALLIASSLPGEGKTTVAMNLSVALAQQGLTCVVDCDLRNSVISSIFHRTSEPGLAEVLAGTIPLADAVFDTHVLDLWVLPSGRARDSYELVIPQGMKKALEELRRRFAFIVLDSPPILPYTEGRILATLVDGVVFVGRPRVTRREAMKRSLELLANVRSAPILEVVLNATESDSADWKYYRYGNK